MFLSKLFRGKKKEAFVIKDYHDFWVWFENNQHDLYRALKSGDPNDFVNMVCEKLDELRPGYYCLAGMMDDITAEFIITADGVIKNFVFVEELVNLAPYLNNWKFTAHKPPHKLEDCNINYEGILINLENLHFVYDENGVYPDEINISVVHDDYRPEDHKKFVSGIFIFLDLLLGEVNFEESIDNLEIVEKHAARKHLIPISKLPEFLIWRQKELIEKYDAEIYNNESGKYTYFESSIENGPISLASINTDVLKWNGKASHSWILKVDIHFKGDNNKLPTPAESENINKVEDILFDCLTWKSGYLHIGHITEDNKRTIFFACREYRNSSKIVDRIVGGNNTFKIDYAFYRDKYWRTFKVFGDAINA